MRKGDCRRITGAASRVLVEPDVDQSGEKSAGGQHDCAAAKADSYLGDHAGDPIALQDNVVHRLLEQGQIGMVLDATANRPAVKRPVGLGACGLHCRALGRVESAELDSCFVGGEGHRAAKRVNLLHQVSFADPTDRRVARHLAEGLDAVCEQQRPSADPCTREGSLAASVAAANHDDVEFGREKHRSIRRRRNDT